MRYNSSKIGVHFLCRWIKGIHNSSLGLDVNESQVIGEYHATRVHHNDHNEQHIVNKGSWWRFERQITRNLINWQSKVTALFPVSIHILFHIVESLPALSIHLICITGRYATNNQLINQSINQLPFTYHLKQLCHSYVIMELWNWTKTTTPSE